MAREKDKDKETEDFFAQEPVKVEPKPVLQKSRIKVVVFDFLKGNIRAKDSNEQMYVIAPSKENSNLKVGDSFFI